MQEWSTTLSCYGYIYTHPWGSVMLSVSAYIRTLGLLTCLLIITDTMMDTAPRILQNGVNLSKLGRGFCCSRPKHKLYYLLSCVKPQCVDLCSSLLSNVISTVAVFIHRHLLFLANSVTVVWGTAHRGMTPTSIVLGFLTLTWEVMWPAWY